MTTTHWTHLIPLIVFSWASQVMRTTPEAAWAYSFYKGAALAILQLAYAWYKKIEFDYIAVGADAFLIYGAAGFLTFPALLAPYDYFQQSTIFLWILIVGIITAITRPEGFLQANTHHYTSKALRGSIILISLVVLAFISSLILTKYFGMGTVISTVAPFVALLSAREVIRKRI